MKSKDSLIWIPIIYIGMVALIFFVSMPMPQDDLLRDIVAGDYDYNYSNLYVFAPFMAKYNQYIAFDITLHWLNFFIDKTSVAHMIQVLCYVLFITPSIMIFHRILKPTNDRFILLTLVLIVLLNNFTLARLVLARPEMLFTIWITWGVLCKILNKQIYTIIWTTIGFLLIPCYWLAFFYTPAIFFILNRKYTKITITILFLMSNIIFWQLFSHNQWLISFLDLPHLYQNRLAVIGENKSIFIWLLTPITSIATVLYGYSYRKQISDFLNSIVKIRSFSVINFKTMRFSLIFNNDLKFACSMIMFCFLSLNMIRYSALVSILFCVLLAIQLQQTINNVPSYIKYIVLCLAIFIPLNVDCYHTIPKFRLPANSVVLGTNQSNYYVPFYSTNIKIAPAMEIGANTKQIQLLMKSIDTEGTVSCSSLKKLGFNFLIERNLTSIPSCLEIYQVQHGWRAWRIKND